MFSVCFTYAKHHTPTTNPHTTMRLNPEFFSFDGDDEADADEIAEHLENEIRQIDSLDDLPEDAKERLQVHRAKFEKMLRDSENDDILSLLAFQGLQIESLQQSAMSMNAIALTLAKEIDKKADL